MCSTKQLLRITAQCHKIVEQVGSGQLDPVVANLALQGIIDGNLPDDATWSPPNWWRTPEQQLERARMLWPDIELPEPPADFLPWTKTEVLLLHVPDSFDGLWSKVISPTIDGIKYSKYSWNGVVFDDSNLRLAPGQVEFDRPVWLAFDPEHGRGEALASFWGRENLATSEVLSAAIQFPDWSAAWFDGASAPNLGGCQFKYENKWTHVPYLARWDSGRRLGLGHYSAGDFDRSRDDRWAYPTARVC